MAGPADYGSLGWDLDESGNLVPKSQPPGTRINSVPDELSARSWPQGNPRVAGRPYFPDVATATRTPNPEMATPGAAPSGNLPAVRPLTTPESSTGTPRYLSPSAVAPESAPTMGGQLTPSSRFGTPAAPPPTFRMPIGPPLVSAIGALAANQPTEAQVNERLNNPLTLKELATAAQQYLWPQTDTQTRTQTQSGPGSSPSGPVPPSPPPPFGPAGPSNYLPPFNRGPIPAYMPQHGPQRAPSIQQQGGGSGARRVLA